MRRGMQRGLLKIEICFYFIFRSTQLNVDNILTELDRHEFILIY